MQDSVAPEHARPYLPPRSGFIVVDGNTDAMCANSDYFAAMLRFGPLPKYIIVPDIKTPATNDDMVCVFSLIDNKPFTVLNKYVNYYTIYQLLEYYMCAGILDKYVQYLRTGENLRATADQMMQIYQIDEHITSGPRIVSAIFDNITQLDNEFIALGEGLKDKLYTGRDTSDVSVMAVLSVLQYWRDYAVYDISTSNASLLLPYLCGNPVVFARVPYTRECIPAISNTIAAGSPVIVPLAEFQQAFTDYSQHVLDNLNWDNIVAAGGYVLQCLSPDTAISGGPTAGDIDLFVYGPTAEIRRATFRRLVLYFAEYKTYFASNGPVTTVCIVGLAYNIQIILTGVESIADVLEDFDLDYVQCAYNGVVYMTVDGLLALKQQCVIRTNGGPANRRIIKAYAKGFSVSTTIGVATDLEVFYKKLRKYKKSGNNMYYAATADVPDSRNRYLMSLIFATPAVYSSADKLLKRYTYEPLRREAEYVAGTKRQNITDVVANMLMLSHGAVYIPSCGGRLIVFKTNITNFAGVMLAGDELSIRLTGGTLDLMRQIDRVIFANLQTFDATAEYEPIIKHDTAAQPYMVVAEIDNMAQHTVYATTNRPALMIDVRRFAAYISIDQVYLDDAVYKCRLTCTKMLVYPAHI